jgi:hypothetical protein
MIFHCARPTRAFGGRALREQEDDQATFPILRSCALREHKRGLIQSSFSLTLPETGLLDTLHCAHRATTVLSWGLCEQEEYEVPR